MKHKQPSAFRSRQQELPNRNRLQQQDTRATQGTILGTQETSYTKSSHCVNLPLPLQPDQGHTNRHFFNLKTNYLPPCFNYPIDITLPCDHKFTPQPTYPKQTIPYLPSTYSYHYSDCLAIFIMQLQPPGKPIPLFDTPKNLLLDLVQPRNNFMSTPYALNTATPTTTKHFSYTIFFYSNN